MLSEGATNPTSAEPEVYVYQRTVGPVWTIGYDSRTESMIAYQLEYGERWMDRLKSRNTPRERVIHARLTYDHYATSQ